MKSCGTYDDVHLILKLYELRREAKMREARQWFFKSFRVNTMEEFEALCPQGSDASAYFRMVVSYWDMAASFITNGVLHQELFFQSGREMLFVWERIREIVPKFREATRDPKAYANLETVANAFIEWMKQRGPNAYKAFLERVHAS